MGYYVRIFLRGRPCNGRPVEFTSEPHQKPRNAIRTARDVLPLGSGLPGQDVVIDDEDGNRLAIFEVSGKQLVPILTAFGTLDADFCAAFRDEMDRKRRRRVAEIDPAEMVDGRRIVVSGTDGREIKGMSEDFSILAGLLGMIGEMPDLPILRAPAMMAISDQEEVSDMERLRAWLVGKDSVLPLSVARALFGRDAPLRGAAEQVRQHMTALGWTLERIPGRKGGLGGGYRWMAPVQDGGDA